MQSLFSPQSRATMGPHRNELTEGCSGIRHGETGGCVVSKRRLGPGRAKETVLTEEIGSDKDVGLFQVSVLKGSSNPDTGQYVPV